MNNEMTPDTARALEAIKPIAEVLGVKVSADRRFLYIGREAIGIACNSTWATVNEFIGYAFYRFFAGEFRHMDINAMQREVILRYFLTEKQLKKINEEETENEGA